MRVSAQRVSQPIQVSLRVYQAFEALALAIWVLNSVGKRRDAVGLQRVSVRRIERGLGMLGVSTRETPSHAAGPKCANWNGTSGGERLFGCIRALATYPFARRAPSAQLP